MNKKAVLLVILANVLWGFIFLIPAILSSYSPIEVALGRYFVYGLTSIGGVLLFKPRLYTSIPRRLWIVCLLYSFLINIVYFVSMIIGIRLTSPAISALILGMAPITIAYWGNWKQGISCRYLLFPSFLIGTGLLAINLPPFLQEESDIEIFFYLGGLLCSFLSLFIWTWFAEMNARILKNTPSLSSHDWSSMMGTGTFVWVFIAMILLPFFQPETLDHFSVWTPELRTYILGSVFLGFGCSTIAYILWNRAAASLPIALAGQLMVFECIFGLLYVYLYESRLPFMYEWTGILLMLGGIIFGVRKERELGVSPTTPTTL